MKKFMIWVITAVLLLSAAACSKAPTWQEQYDLGVKYLTDGNYEEAIIAFTAAIEIEPKRAESYEMLAQVYVQTGDGKQAVAVLEQGVQATGSEWLAQLLERYQDLWMFGSDMIAPEELMVGDVPFWEFPITDIPAKYPSNYISPVTGPTEIIEKEEGYYYSSMTAAPEDWTMIQAWSSVGVSQMKGDPGLSEIHYGLDNQEYGKTCWADIPLDIRGLEAKMSRAAALAQLGISEAGIEEMLTYDKSVFLSNLEGVWSADMKSYTPEEAAKPGEMGNLSDYTKGDVSRVWLVWYTEDDFMVKLELEFLFDQLHEVDLERQVMEMEG